MQMWTWCRKFPWFYLIWNDSFLIVISQRIFTWDWILSQWSSPPADTVNPNGSWYCLTGLHSIKCCLLCQTESISMNGDAEVIEMMLEVSLGHKKICETHLQFKWWMTWIGWDIVIVSVSERECQSCRNIVQFLSFRFTWLNSEGTWNHYLRLRLTNHCPSSSAVTLLCVWMLRFLFLICRAATSLR